MVDLRLLCLLLVVSVHLPAYGKESCQALSGYVAANPGCRVGSSCHEVMCSNQGLALTAPRLTVSNCEDPVQLVVSVEVTGTTASIWNQTFSATGLARHCQIELAPNYAMSVTYSRNVSHLQFEAIGIVDGGSFMLPLIPAVTIPLNLRSCTCDDLEDATNHFQFPIPSVTHQCSVDTTTCTGFLCHINADTQLDSKTVVDPCSESLTVTVTDVTSQQQVFHQVFMESRAMQFHVESFTPTVYVLINHYTYSMTVSVVMNLVTNITLLPEERIVLDRSSCSNTNRFPAAPFLSDGCGVVPTTTSGPYPNTGSNIPHPRTTAKSYVNTTAGTTKGSSSLVVAVAVPVSLIMVAFLTVCIGVVAFLGFLHIRKRREVRFRRVAFEKMEDDDDDMI